jgi:pilus assembly protein CpaD
MRLNIHTIGRLTGALALGAAVAACSTSDPSVNSSLYSVHQPVVTRSAQALDLATDGSGLAPVEAQRLAGWFDTLALRDGDRVTVSDALRSEQVRADIAALAASRGVLLDLAASTEGPLEPGLVRVTVSRSEASVPGCPDWSDRSDASFGNTTSRNFGCAVNSNFAAMVANPEHLVKGAEDTGETVAMSASKAIAAYRAGVPTGANGLPETSSRDIGE